MAHLFITTPTIVATVDSAIAAAIVVLVTGALDAPTAAVVASGAAAFLVVWGVLFSVQQPTRIVLGRIGSRFRTPVEPA